MLSSGHATIVKTNSKLLNFMRRYSLSKHRRAITRLILHPRCDSGAIPVDIQVMIVGGDEKTVSQLVPFSKGTSIKEAVNMKSCIHTLTYLTMRRTLSASNCDQQSQIR